MPEGPLQGVRRRFFSASAIEMAGLPLIALDAVRVGPEQLDPPADSRGQSRSISGDRTRVRLRFADLVAMQQSLLPEEEFADKTMA